MWTLNPINNPSSSLDSTLVNFKLIYMTQIILAPYIMRISPRENPQLGGVQEQNNSLQKLRVGKQPIGIEFKISFYNLKREATKINQIYKETYKKFLRAIDHMEFHPTLGRAKTGSTIRLKRQPKGKDKTIKASQYINQMEGLTKEDKLMLRQANELIETFEQNY